MIRLQHVTKIFPNGVKALDDVTLNVEESEFVFLVGSSGAGKSTLLKLLYQADQPTGGDVHIHRFNVGKLTPKQTPYLRRNIGIVFQDYKLLPRRTVYENIAFAMRVVGAPRYHIRRRVAQVLDL